MFVWHRGLAATDFHGPVTPPHAMRNRRLQHVVFVAWTFAVPAMAVEFALNAVPLLAGGAWTLLAAVVASTVENARLVWPVVAGFPAARARLGGLAGISPCVSPRP